MYGRIQEYEAEYRRRLAAASVVAVALHIAAGLALDVHRSRVQRPTQDRLELGYRGPRRILPELEVLEANSIQAFFYQKQREGRTRAVNYRVLLDLPLTPGPEPVPERGQHRPEPVTPDLDAPEPVVPQVALHREISFSEDFVIVKLVKPTYPEYELERRIRATIVVAVYITAQGEFVDAQIQDARTDPASAPTRGFEIATLEAMHQWKALAPRNFQAPGMWRYYRFNFQPTGVTFADAEVLPAP